MPGSVEIARWQHRRRSLLSPSDCLLLVLTSLVAWHSGRTSYLLSYFLSSFPAGLLIPLAPSFWRFTSSLSCIALRIYKLYLLTYLFIQCVFVVSGQTSSHCGGDGRTVSGCRHKSVSAEGQRMAKAVTEFRRPRSVSRGRTLIRASAADRSVESRSRDNQPSHSRAPSRWLSPLSSKQIRVSQRGDNQPSHSRAPSQAGAAGTPRGLSPVSSKQIRVNQRVSEWLKSSQLHDQQVSCSVSDDQGLERHTDLLSINICLSVCLSVSLSLSIYQVSCSASNDQGLVFCLTSQLH